MKILLERNKSNKYPFSPKFVSEILWRLANIDFYNEKIYKKLCESVVKVIKNMNAKDCTWSFYALCK